ncbi:dopamine receptor 1-like [Octopus sinensis]|uniref:Dopamine receptor 1-like n=1 Tax=Octopus sinensis TaxID=2607531 RepID=A0A7E6F7P2_9MOLL|nr:dopamine receptor 1-like [Octopus sinensis]XP_036363775.1 dopamine receptor 1-like [Octopus sinensis]XP_036363776.1 dopamine receptor 1-like [Octopus sinensis]XP_036363777.1 dopamine receptor 1-like [Octopus sinensis]
MGSYEDSDGYKYVYTLYYNSSAGKLIPVEGEDGKTRYGMVIFQGLLAFWGFLANLILIIALVSSKSARRLVITLYILSLTTIQLLMCVVNLPFAVYDDLHKWSLGQRFCEAWVLMDVTLSCISALVIVMMNIDRLMFVLDAKRYVKNMKVIALILMVIFPWLLGISLVIIIWVKGKQFFPDFPGMCVYALHKEYAMVSPFVMYFIPALIILGLTFAILVTVVLHPHHRQPPDGTHMFDEQGQPQLPYPFREHNSLFSVCLVNFFFLAMSFPYNCENAVMAFCETDNCMPPSDRPHIFYLLGISFLGLNPLLWLTYQEVRGAFLRIFENICKR